METETVAVLAPAVYVSVTIEEAEEGDDIHIHAGGQGIWVARMLRQLDHHPVVCAPIGGEAGRTLLGLVRDWSIELRGVEVLADTPTYVHDRRGGERVELARSRSPALRRHEADELYDSFLQAALDAGRCVITGPDREGALPLTSFERLGTDLASAGIGVVADLHGEALDAFLAGGPIEILKVSSGDLVEDGRLRDDERDADEAIDQIADELVERGVANVIVSRGGEAMLATTPEGRFRITGPELAPIDTKGSGDSMTAALASALVHGADPQERLARAWAAGAANVTRRGLGSANAGLIEQLTERAKVEPR